MSGDMYNDVSNHGGMIHKGAAAVETLAGKVEDRAGKVKNVAGAVRQATRKRGRNSKHRATRAARPSGVIVRQESNALPDIAARIFVNPLANNKLLYGKPILVHPAGFNSGSLAEVYFDNYVYQAFATCVIQHVRYSLTNDFTLAQLRSYFNKLSAFYFTYRAIAIQRAFATNPESQSQRLNVRIQQVTLARVEQALKNAQFVLSQFVLPPRLAGMLDWLGNMYSLGRTPNANVAQFITPEINTATNANELADILVAISTSLSADDRRLSGILGKVFPDWRLTPQLYIDMPDNTALDFNWLNVWYNMGINDGGTFIDPRDIMEYVLFNDNPNAMCTALATMYETTTGQFEPDLIEPSPTPGSDYTGFVDDGTGLYVQMLPTNERLLGALRNREYQPVTPGTNISPESAPEAKSITLERPDLEMDSASIMYNLFHIEDVINKSKDMRRT